MSEPEETEEERPHESEPNPTQKRMDETGQSESDRPVDIPWEDDDEEAS